MKEFWSYDTESDMQKIDELSMSHKQPTCCHHDIDKTHIFNHKNHDINNGIAQHNNDDTQSKRNQSITGDEIRHILQSFIIATTLKDISIIIALQIIPIDNGNDNNDH